MGGRLSADGIKMHPQHIRKSLGHLPPSLRPVGRHQLPRLGQKITTPGRSGLALMSPGVTTTYSVTVTTVEACEGTDEVRVLVRDATAVFIDCFESGDTSMWSETSP